MTSAPAVKQAETSVPIVLVIVVVVRAAETIAVVVAVTGAATAADVAIADSEITLTTFSSGLRVVSEHVPGALSVSAGVWVGVGARDEPHRVCGVSHFLEHLLFKGTERRTAREIASSTDRVGGDMNAFTAKEYKIGRAHV